MSLLILDENKNIELNFISEPELEFGYSQKCDNPRYGLFAFGPLQDSSQPKEMRVGVVGTEGALNYYREWVKKIQTYIPTTRPESAHQMAFPGFEAVFGCKWPKNPIVELPISDVKIHNAIRSSNEYERVKNAVAIYSEAIEKHLNEEDENVTLWFVLIHDDVHRYCRPNSRVPREIATTSNIDINYKIAKRILSSQPSLFSEDNEQAEIFQYAVDFHNQLKARMLKSRAVVQIVRESTLMGSGDYSQHSNSRRMQDDANIAWNLCTTSFFKSGGHPWKLAGMRDGVCYIGLVFKKEREITQKGNACCGAQLFLNSGDGLVFKLSRGNYFSEDKGEFHLDYEKSKDLMKKVIQAYKDKWGDKLPKEIFIHGKTRFNEEEWRGFQDAAQGLIKLVAIRITSGSDLKLYRLGTMPVFRGTAYIYSKKKGYLWTKGYVPRLQTYPGREVPNPLLIEIVHGEGEIIEVMNDVLKLTKVNFNACIYADGIPVTLRFADSVGEILTAMPKDESPPLPFKHYI